MDNVIALVFDFDDTLAPDTTSGFLNEIGVDVKDFWKIVQNDISDGWDSTLAYFNRMIEVSESGKYPPITRELLVSWGKKAPLHRGVPAIFASLRKHLRKNFPNVKIEFFVISSGIGDVVKNTKIADEFKGIWCSEFFYSDEKISFPKSVISFTDKTRYLFQISKGLIGEEYSGMPFEVNKKLDSSKFYIPFKNMIFVGDGLTDVPCFALVKRNGGITIGVYDKNESAKWGKAWGFVSDGRLTNLAAADYSPKSTLYASLIMAVESIAARMGS